jgi:hypothetical protein
MPIHDLAMYHEFFSVNHHPPTVHNLLLISFDAIQTSSLRNIKILSPFRVTVDGV